MRTSMFRSFVAIASTVVLGNLLQCSVLKQQKPYRGRPLDIPHTDEQMDMDGRDREKSWSDALQVPLRWRVGGPGSGPKWEKPHAHAKLLWDDQNLYLFAWCSDRDIISSFRGRDQKLWNEDVFELFIKPKREAPQYWEYEWSPSGEILDLAFPSREKRNFQEHRAWNGGGDYGVHVDGTLNDREVMDDGWQVEARIPFADFKTVLQETPETGDTLTGTVSHYDYTIHPKIGKKLSATCPNGFHHYESYHTMKLVKE